MDSRAWLTIRMGVVGVIIIAIYAPLLAFFVHIGVSPLIVLAGLCGALCLQYWLGKHRALASVNAVKLPPEEPTSDFIYSRTQIIADDFGVPMPSIWMCDTGSMNAFAVGRKGNGHIVLEKSLVEFLSPNQLSAVLAHEVSHLRSRDVIPMELGAGASAIVFYLFAIIEEILIPTQSADTHVHESTHSVAGTLAHTLVMALVFAISRQREFIADEDAKQIMNDGEPLAEALAIIEASHREGYTHDPPEAVETLAISGHWKIPLLGSTHPSVEARMDRLLNSE